MLIIVCPCGKKHEFNDQEVYKGFSCECRRDIKIRMLPPSESLTTKQRIIKK